MNAVLIERCLTKMVKRLLCRHYRVTYHGHPDAPLGLCLECGSVK